MRRNVAEVPHISVLLPPSRSRENPRGRLFHSSAPRVLRKTRDVRARGPPLRPYFVVFEKFLTLPLHRRRGDGSGHSGSRFDQITTRRDKKIKHFRKMIYVLFRKGMYINSGILIIVQ